jgi:hypothetical protein
MRGRKELVIYTVLIGIWWNVRGCKELAIA